jgi:SAM-dependent methyltransferase
MINITRTPQHPTRSITPQMYWLGLRVGIKLLLRQRWIPALKKLIQPVSYWRVPAYKFVFDAANFVERDVVLDIGSPKLFALYLAQTIGATVYATDIDDYFIEEYRLIRQIEGISPDKLQLKAEDGRQLTFPDNYFTKVYSISVIEHIPNEGDTACVQEIARVLRPGGRCIITTPFAPIYRDEFKDAKAVYWARHTVRSEDGRVFYQRRYSERDLFERLIKPSGLTLKQLVYIGETVMVNSNQELIDKLPKISGPVHPLLSTMFHTQLMSNWKDLKKPLSAYLVLEKGG